jgi:hypothetical protein
MIYLENSTPNPTTHKAKRKSITPRLAPDDFQLFASLCDAEGRSYGEMLSLLVRDYVRSQKSLGNVTSGVRA